MIWRDVVVHFPHADEALRTVIASALHVDPQRVTVIRDIEDLGSGDIVCLRAPLAGAPFDTLLTFYLSSEPQDTWATYARLAAALDSPLLVADDEDSDPYSMIHIDQAGRRAAVRVAAEPLDERNEYVIEDWAPAS